MKKWILLSMTLVLTSLTATAQDDMYFASSKKMKAEREAAREARTSGRGGHSSWSGGGGFSGGGFGGGVR